VKDENGDLLAESHILNRWKNCFSQLLNAHRVNDIRQIEIHTAEPLGLDLSSVDVETAITKSTPSVHQGVSSGASCVHGISLLQEAFVTWKVTAL
jgi:hypothetical protein